MTEPQWDLGLAMWEMYAKFLPPRHDGTCHLCVTIRPATAYVTQLTGNHLVNVPMCRTHLRKALMKTDQPMIREIRKD